MSTNIKLDRTKIRFIDLGLGQVACGVSIDGGLPCIAFATGIPPGDIGESPEKDKLEVAEHTVLRFHTMEAILRHMERIKEVVQQLQDANGISDHDIVEIGKLLGPEEKP